MRTPLTLSRRPVLSAGIDADSADATARDLSNATVNAERQGALRSLGAVSAHTRPVQCLAADVQAADGKGADIASATLYTADSMGAIFIWTLERTYGDAPGCRATQIGSVTGHRTGVNDICYAKGELWTGSYWQRYSRIARSRADCNFAAASSDDTALLTLLPAPEAPARAPPPIQHPTAVRALLPLAHTPIGEPLLVTAAGDVLRLYDVSEPANPSLLSTTDAHWHNIIALGLWYRRTGGSALSVCLEPWIVSASLDGTIRRWKLEGMH